MLMTEKNNKIDLFRSPELQMLIISVTSFKRNIVYYTSLVLVKDEVKGPLAE